MNSLINQKLPESQFKTLSSNRIDTFPTSVLFDGKKIFVIGGVGAFTPICTKQHLPDFIPYAKQLKDEKIIDEVFCICVTDPFVLSAWAKSLGLTDEIIMLTDTNAEFTKKIGLNIDLSDLGLGIRSTRFAMLVEDSVITLLNVEKQPQDINTTSKANISRWFSI
ncbi:peroxiredoxin family protein [Pseudoalteromonas denitrificans]|uniref:Glutathione-dependent peroxiredoxin n=1 Tax=Pseudoalteromonas denitrificans DSM 6059 TaxID=1123010 RepID=A0A1I1MPN2_9GAMM|nr:peroxiredoxin [Pseudoalteromonas denitrificans]SFC87444.1 Peroxiredoxin [Pseudoalteromonas denitrificans DSM 6059]